MNRLFSRLLLIGMLTAAASFAQARLDALATACNLNKDQKTLFKTTLDASTKEAEPLRKAIPQTRAQIAALVQAGKSGDELNKLVSEHASQMAAMYEIEAKTFAKLVNSLDADQKKQGAQRLLGEMRGLFLKNKWSD